MSKQNFNQKLTALLKTHPRFVDDSGELLNTAVKDHAWQLDHTLIRLLLSDEEIKAKFFDEIDGHWISTTTPSSVISTTETFSPTPIRSFGTKSV